MLTQGQPTGREEGEKMLERPREENLTKIIRWETGELECHHGTLEETQEYVKEKEKKTGVKCAAII